jgi:arylsulfatase A
MKTLLTSLLFAFGVFLISPAPAKPDLLIVCANDLGETTNLAAAQPEKLAGMQALLERLIVEGRSTPWARQKNDQRVNRYPVAAKAKGKGE